MKDSREAVQIGRIFPTGVDLRWPRRRRFFVGAVGPLMVVILLTLMSATECWAAMARQQVDSPQDVRGEEPAVEEATANSRAIMRTAHSALQIIMARRPTVNSQPGLDQVIRSTERLDELSGFLPGSNWIAGHRVGLRVMTGDLINALRAAHECAAEEWWCSMLSGYVLHILEDFAAAEAAFDAGLAAMTPEHRCRWMDDLRLILDGELLRLYRNSDCAARVQWERRIWWLSNPLYLRPGNDRKTEHLARTVAMHLHHEALDLVGESCTDHHAAEIQMGWERWAISYLFAAPAGEGGYAFIPFRSARTPLAASAGDWNLYADPALERYAPRYGPIGELDTQIAMFIRDDSVAVVAGAEIGGRPLAEGRIRDQGLILSRSEMVPPLIAPGERDGDRFVFRAMIPAEPHLVGIELLTEDRGAARARFGYAPPTRTPGEIGLSDLLLFDWDAGLTDGLDAVAPRAVGTHRIRRSRDIGIFWEIYGVVAGEEVDLSLVMRRDVGVLGRLAAALRLRGNTPPIALAWKEEVPSDRVDIVDRSLRVGMGHLPAGEYTLEIRARRMGGETRTTSKTIQLIDG